VTAVSRGVVTDDDVRLALARLRDEIATTAAALERTRFAGRATGRQAADRDEMVALASDFAARAREASGVALRELLRPWLADAVIDKDARTLTLSIRCLPATMAFLPAFNGPGRDERWQESGPVVQRVLNLPAKHPPPRQGASKSAGVRRRRRAA
jgi:hypothetical protein